jgi:hypothetical protein
MIRLFLIIQMPDASDERVVPLTLCPVDGFSLRLKSFEDVIRMVFYDIILNGASITALMACFNVDARHSSSPYGPILHPTQSTGSSRDSSSWLGSGFHRTDRNFLNTANEAAKIPARCIFDIHLNN